MQNKVIVQLTGGLGNQLFQYATARSLALKQNMSLKLDINFFKTYEWHDYSLNPFNIKKDYLSEEEIHKSLYEKPLWVRLLNRLGIIKGTEGKIYNERSLEYDSNIFGLNTTTYLKGYWQSEKYFKDIEDVIREDFRIIPEPSAANEEILQRIKSVNAVSLHVRRGNFVTEPHLLAFHGTCSLDYYKAAVNYIKERVAEPEFFLFSNDINWCRDTLDLGIKIHYVDINDDKTDYEDLRLMMHCNHNILANSTFSWWGAWLNENPDKMVIAPQRWFADEAMQAQTGDLIPETWIRL